MARLAKPATQIYQPNASSATILQCWIQETVRAGNGSTTMDEPQAQSLSQAGHARRPSGRDAKRASRAAQAASSIPYITRKITHYEVLTEEGLALMEHNADTILEEIGIDFRDDPEALEIC